MSRARSQVEGYVIGSCVKHIPLAGRDVTNFILDQLRARGEEMPPEDALQVAKTVKVGAVARTRGLQQRTVCATGALLLCLPEPRCGVREVRQGPHEVQEVRGNQLEDQ